MSRGQTLVETALILALVCVVAIVTLHVLGRRVSGVFACTAQSMEHDITRHCGPAGRL